MIEIKRAVVTGASTGIGRATSIMLAEHGYHVTGVARSREALEDVSTAIEERGGRFDLHVCDVTDHDQVRETCDEIAGYGGIDVLVNNAGVLRITGFEDMELSDMHEMMDTNYWGTVHFTKGLLDHMGDGSVIVNVSSILGRMGIPDWAAYSASKFAVAGLSESLYHELRPRGIHVGLVCPAGVDTPLYDDCGWSEEEVERRTAEMMPPEKVADAVLDVIENRRFETEVTWRDGLLVRLKGLWPGLVRRLIHRKYMD